MVVSKLVQALTEQYLDHGTLFVVNTDAGRQFVRPYATSSTSMKEASREFLQMWATRAGDAETRQTILTYDPMALLGSLIQEHNLIILRRPRPKVQEQEGDEADIGPEFDFAPAPREPAIHIEQPVSKQVRYRVADVDGVLDHQEVRNLIRNGKIDNRTRLKYVGDKFNWKLASSFKEFARDFAEADHGQGGLSTPDSVTQQLTHDLAQEPIKRTHLVMVSNTPTPRWQPDVRTYILGTFELQPDDTIYWISSLRVSQAERRLTAGEVFGIEKQHARR